MSLTTEFTTYIHEGLRRIRDHKIEIIDTEGGGPIGQFKCDYAQTVSWTDEGVSRSAWQDIQGKTMRFRMEITTPSHIAFARNLAEGKENRFIVRHSTSDTSYVSNYVIFMDETTVVRGPNIQKNSGEAPTGYIDIVAIDSITLLDGYLFEVTDGPEFASGYQISMAEAIGRCLSKLPTKDFLPGSPWAANVYWQPDKGSGLTFLEKTHVYEHVFMDKQRNGGLVPKTCLEVLKMICCTYHMRVIYQGGVYLFEQLPGKLQGGGILGTVGYTLAGTVGSAPTFFGGLVPLCTDQFTILGTDQRTYKPPLDFVRVTYNSSFNPNLTYDKEWRFANQASEIVYGPLITLAVEHALFRLRFFGTIEYIPRITSVLQSQHLPQVQIRYYLVIRLGSWYYNREFLRPDDTFINPALEEELWEQSAGKYYLGRQLITMPDGNGKVFTSRISAAIIASKPIPVAANGENLFVGFGQELLDKNNNPIFESTMVVQTILDDLDTTVIANDPDNPDEEPVIVEQSSLVVTLENDPDNSLSIEKEIFFSDGPNESSERRHTEGSVPPQSMEEWTAQGLGTGQHIKILVNSLMSLGANKQEYLESILCGRYNTFQNISYDGQEWVWIKGTHSIADGTEFFQGELLAVKDYTPSGNLTLEPQKDLVERPVPLLPGDSGSDVEVIELTDITGDRINADDFNIPMPDTTNWQPSEKRRIVQLSKNGLEQFYDLTEPRPPDPQRKFRFWFESTSRDFVLNEDADAEDIFYFRIFIVKPPGLN